MLSIHCRKFEYFRHSGCMLPATLSFEQLQIMNLIKTGFSMVLLGRSGTGKTTLIRQLAQELRCKPGVFFTGMTGSASCLIDDTAMTIHSLFGLGCSFRWTNFQGVIDTMSPHCRVNIRNANLLVIDEVSMMSRVLFDLIDFVSRQIRRTDEPFGGIQIVLVGDLNQLPPVEDALSRDPRSGDWFFQSNLFSKIAGESYRSGPWKFCELKTVYRQPVETAEDQSFTDALFRFARNTLRRKDIEFLATLDRPISLPAGIVPTMILVKGSDAQQKNREMLYKLVGAQFDYAAVDTGPLASMLDALTSLPQEVSLKVGCPVIAVKNFINQKVCSGQQGTVIGFSDPGELKRSGLEVLGDLPDDSTKVPIVCFGSLGKFAVAPVSAIIQPPGSDVLATRVNLPLLLGWAVTCGRSQGMTLDAVHVQCPSNGYKHGYLYCALSRVKSYKSLQLAGFKKEYLRNYRRNEIYDFRLAYFPTADAQLGITNGLKRKR